MKRILAVLITLCIVATAFAACANETSGNPSANPSQQVDNSTLVPKTLKPIITEPPTQEPEPTPAYNEAEIGYLTSFFDGLCEDGESFGSHIFDAYESDNPDTWTCEDNPNYYVSLVWTDHPAGKQLSRLYIQEKVSPSDQVITPYKLDRSLVFFGDKGISTSSQQSTLYLFGDLEYLWIDNLELHSISIYGCDKLQHIALSKCTVNSFEWQATHHCDVHSPYAQEINIDFVDCGYNDNKYEIELTVGGNRQGSVQFSTIGDEHYALVYIEARANEGSKFVGWYDLEGNLVSTEQSLELSSEEMLGCFGCFLYKAVFDWE